MTCRWMLDAGSGVIFIDFENRVMLPKTLQEFSGLLMIRKFAVSGGMERHTGK